MGVFIKQNNQLVPVGISNKVSSASLQAKTNIIPTTSSQTITPDSGYDGLSSVQINAMPVGSARTPNSLIEQAPQITFDPEGGYIQADIYATGTITPVVTPGYVSSGTAGVVDVAGTTSMTFATKGAQTYTPTTTNQTVSADQYLTGAQTILGDANLTAENIKKDVSIFGVTGTYEGSGGGSSKLYIFTQSTYGTADAAIGGSYLTPMWAFTGNSIVNGATVTFYTYGGYILDSITGEDSGTTYQFTTIQRGQYTFIMPNESVYCGLLYDD